MRLIKKKRNIVLLLVILILAVASFLRLWKLNALPPGLWPDVAMNGNDAIKTLKTGNFKVFYPDNFGREGLMIWLIALSFSFFGISIWSIKIVSALIGILTVFGLYLLTNELLLNFYKNNSKYIALISSFLLSVSFWHINLSRIGFRAILVPFILVFALYFLIKALKKESYLYSLISGVILGFGFYSYTSYRFVVLFLILIFIIYWINFNKRNQLKKFLFLGASVLASIFVVALPLGIYFLKHPDCFLSRAAGVSIFSTDNSLKYFFVSLATHLGMFNFYGDPNWRHNLSGSPMLSWPVGIFFLIGVIYSFYVFIKSTKSKETTPFALFGILIGWWLIMLLPGILTYEGIPHSLRVVGTIPPVYILSGIGAWQAYQFFNRNSKKKKLLLCASFLLLISIGFSGFNKYFLVWGRSKNLDGSFAKKFFDIGNYLNSLPQDFKKYLIINEPGKPLYGISIDAQTPMFIESTKFGKPRASYITFENLGKIKIIKGKTIIIPFYNMNSVKEIKKKFPQGEIRKEKEFLIYKI